ncbi:MULTISPECIES: oligosaccharide flippase family protein [Haloferax]|uniref:oligosaccharide flippase family protein n=1 Tax=Haloferax TaxID=2251 RepID=UPI0012AFFF4A|nr:MULTISPECIES: oligosaccharide flippase family protein [Haloferax]
MSDETTPSDTNLARETSLGALAKTATLLLAFGGTIIFGRILGPTGYGGFYLMLSLAQIAQQGSNGWAIAGTKRFSEDISKEQRREVVGAGLLGALVVVCIGALVATAFSSRLDSYIGIDGALGPFLALLVGISFYTTLEHLTAGRGLVSVTNWGETFQTLFAFPLQLALVLLGFGVVGMGYGYALGYLLVIPLFLYYIDILPALPSRAVVRRIWDFARYSIPSSFLGRIYTRMDVLLIGLLVGQAAAGYYEAAYRISIPASFIAAVAAPAVMARTSEKSSKGDSVSEDLHNTLSYSAIVAIPIFFGALVLSRNLVVTLYGPAYADAALLLIGLTFYRVIRTQTRILLEFIQGINRPDFVLKLESVAVVVNIVLGVLLTLEFGPIGVVIATILAESIRYVGFIVVVRNWVVLRDLLPTQLAQQSLAGAVMALAVGLLVDTFPIHSWWELTIVVGVGGLLYGCVLLAISVQHRQLVREVLSNFDVING